MQTILSLFSGIGGLERGTEAATGARVVCQVERDPFACRILARHWPEAERLDDVAAVGPEWRGVDLLCGGFPCQPHSLTGKREAGDDERDLWPETARILREVQPRAAIFENVPGLLTSRTDPKNPATKGHFFLRILKDCAKAGYLVRWDCCPASAVGAQHRRDRVFLVCTRFATGWPNMTLFPIQEPLFGTSPIDWPRAGAWTGQAYEARPRWPVMGDTKFCTPTSSDGGRRGDPDMAERWASGEVIKECHRRLRTQVLQRWPTPRASDSNGAGAHGSGGLDLRTAVSEWPTPTARDWRSGKHSTETGERNAKPLSEVAWQKEGKPESGALNPDWVEWLMGFPPGWTLPEGDSLQHTFPLPIDVEPAIPRTTTEKKDRRQRLERLGNAVVPAVAEAVARSLLSIF